MAYTVEEKATAIAILNRHGGMTREALQDINTALGRTVSTSTLHGWLPKIRNRIETETENPKAQKKAPRAVVTPEHLEDAEETLDGIFEQVARRYLKHALNDNVVNDTKGKEAVTAAAISVDKMRVLRGLPTEIIEIIPTIQALYAALTAAGVEPATVFNKMLQRVSPEYHQ